MNNNFNLRGFISENNLSQASKLIKEQTVVVGDEVAETAPGFDHDCAAHVVHETYGYGVCIAGEHTLVENAETGKHEVTHYDVFFKNEGIKKDIPVNELDIRTIEEHVHGKRKKNEESLEEEDLDEMYGDGAEALNALLGAGGLTVGALAINKIMDALETGKMGEKGKAVAKHLRDMGKAAGNMAQHRNEVSLEEEDDREDDELSPEELANKHAGSPFISEETEESLKEAKFKENIKNILNS